MPVVKKLVVKKKGYVLNVLPASVLLLALFAASCSLLSSDEASDEPEIIATSTRTRSVVCVEEDDSDGLARQIQNSEDNRVVCEMIHTSRHTAEIVEFTCELRNSDGQTIETYEKKTFNNVDFGDRLPLTKIGESEDGYAEMHCVIQNLNQRKAARNTLECTSPRVEPEIAPSQIQRCLITTFCDIEKERYAVTEGDTFIEWSERWINTCPIVYEDLNRADGVNFYCDFFEIGNDTLIKSFEETAERSSFNAFEGKYQFSYDYEFIAYQELKGEVECVALAIWVKRNPPTTRPPPTTRRPTTTTPPPPPDEVLSISAQCDTQKPTRTTIVNGILVPVFTGSIFQCIVIYVPDRVADRINISCEIVDRDGTRVFRQDRDHDTYNARAGQYIEARLRFLIDYQTLDTSPDCKVSFWY